MSIGNKIAATGLLLMLVALVNFTWVSLFSTKSQGKAAAWLLPCAGITIAGLLIDLWSRP